jgi:tripartite-type tricarboxylate transporter receptor subunit TctC
MLTRRATLAGMAALGFSSAAGAQGFPSRSITIIVPYPPGGPVDALARLIAQEAAGHLNQPIVVENRPGGSGIIGAQAVARAEPDGHVLVLGTNQTHAANQSLFKNCPYDAVRDFAPVAGIAAMPHVLVVRKSLALTSVGDVVAKAKAKPGTLAFGSTGNGSGATSPANCSRPRPASKCCTCPSRASHPCSRSCWQIVSTSASRHCRA